MKFYIDLTPKRRSLPHQKSSKSLTRLLVQKTIILELSKFTLNEATQITLHTTCNSVRLILMADFTSDVFPHINFSKAKRLGIDATPLVKHIFYTKNFLFRISSNV